MPQLRPHPGELETCSDTRNEPVPSICNTKTFQRGSARLNFGIAMVARCIWCFRWSDDKSDWSGDSLSSTTRLLFHSLILLQESIVQTPYASRSDDTAWPIDVRSKGVLRLIPSMCQRSGSGSKRSSPSKKLIGQSSPPALDDAQFTLWIFWYEANSVGATDYFAWRF